ncbi:LysR family transcriptional regulator [Streptomyces anthocyanicus]|uniref:LysR family transcriptional regulator n=1 Tax=Streptomyces anthocyanicus TaxID=68174 RepID=UPI0037FA518B
MPEPFTPVTHVDLRLVRYSLVVAAHRHFGRDAGALRVGQPSLSRQIRRLETQVGARLLDRTTRGTRLTEAREVFRGQAEVLLRSAERAVVSARSASQPGGVTVGYTADLVVTPALRPLRRRHPQARARTLHLRSDDPAAALLRGRADAVVARLPFRTDHLDVPPYGEPRVPVTSVDHRLAGRGSVTQDDIADEALPRMPGEAWNAFWRIDPRPDGTRAPDGPLVEAIEDEIELVAGNEAVSIAPAGVRRFGLRPELTAVPLSGVAPGHVVLATRAGEHGRLVESFRELALRHLTGCWADRAGNLARAGGIGGERSARGKPRDARLDAVADEAVHLVVEPGRVSAGFPRHATGERGRAGGTAYPSRLPHKSAQFT